MATRRFARLSQPVAAEGSARRRTAFDGRTSPSHLGQRAAPGRVKLLSMAMRKGRIRDEQRRVLRLLARSLNGHTAAMLLAHGFTNEMLGRLVIDGLATATPVHAAKPPLKVVRIADHRCRTEGARRMIDLVLRRPAETTATIFSNAGGPCSSIQDGTCGLGCREPPFRHR